MTTHDLIRLDKQHIWHPFTHHKIWMESTPLVITHAEGMFLFDSDGNQYIDGVSSLWCNVHGHRVPEIDQAIRDQLDKVAHSTLLGLAGEQSILLADRLMQIVPSNLTKVFYSDAGATATEVAFKMAVQYWHNIGQRGKTDFIGFTDAYHGDTFGAMAVGRTEHFHKPYFPMLFKSHFAPTPNVYRSNTPDDPEACKNSCLKALENILKQHSQTIAAICIEPIVQGAAGMIVHPDGFLRGVRELADQYNVLLICDEVAVGFGRTGLMFACEHEAVQPDLMCVAKGITGGYLPLAATFATQQIFDAFIGEPVEGKTFFHGHTYTGNPLACAAAIASLNLFEENNLLQTVQGHALELSMDLNRLDSLKHVGDIRQKGLMIGIELVENKSTRKSFDSSRRIGAEFCHRLRQRGLILRPLGDVIVLMPPLAMPMDMLRDVFNAIAISLEEMESWV